MYLPSSRALRAALLLGSMSLAAVAARAQQVPPPPPPPVPEQRLPTREQIQSPVPEAARPESQVRIDGNRAFRESPCPFDASDARVLIERVHFTGVDGAPLEPELWRALAGIDPAEGEQAIAQICDIRDAANRALRAAGYVASVQIPPQEIVGGNLTLSVITARIVDIKIENAPGRYGNLIAARAQKLKNLVPFNQNDAERILLLAGDVPGLDVQLSLSPAGTRPGEVVGTLNVAFTPYALVANAQNYSSKTLGRETLFYRAEIYGPTGLGDMTYAGLSTTVDNDEQQVFQLGHSMALGSGGTRLEGNLSYALSRPDFGLDFRSESIVGSVAITSPFVRTTRANLNLTGGVDVVSQRTRWHIGSFEVPISHDELRVGFLRASGSYVHPDPAGFGYSLSGGLELRHGLGILGASRRFWTDEEGASPSRAQGDPQATVVRLDADGQFSLGPLLSLNASLRAQRASNPLFNYEQFSVGSLTVGRGYDPGAVSGDSAIAVRNELRGTFYRGPYGAAELYTFIDYAWLWNHPNFDFGLAQFDDDPDNRRIVRSSGFGARVSLPGSLLLDVTYARPLDPISLRGNGAAPDDRVLVSLTTQFSPPSR